MAFYLTSTAYVPAADSADWDARNVANIRRPAFFLYLDWPSGVVRASTFHKEVTIDGNVWSGVGNLAFIETAPSRPNSALTVYKAGISSLPQDAITEATEKAAIGRRAILYEGLFDEAWENPVLKQVFIGRIINAGDFDNHRVRNDDGTFTWLTAASIEFSNGRNPRGQLSNHHSIETAESGDTAWRHLPGVGQAQTWPN